MSALDQVVAWAIGAVLAFAIAYQCCKTKSDERGNRC